MTVFREMSVTFELQHQQQEKMGEYNIHKKSTISSNCTDLHISATWINFSVTINSF